MSLPTAHPAFSAHFTDPLYEDEGEDLGPFGHDEGWDLVMEWGERRDELDGASTIATVLDCEPAEVLAYAGEMAGIDGADTAHFVWAAGFVLLRLTGRISDADRDLVLAALDFWTATFGAEPQLETQRADLVSWRNP